MSPTKLERGEEALSVAQKAFDILFDRAPVMMHAVDKDFRIVKVNRRWLQMLGYKRDEVLGRKPTDFVSEESRAEAVNVMVPRFWRIGSDRGLGVQFVKRDGRILDLLLDAEVSPATMGNYYAYAALRDGHDRLQWEQASTTIRTLQELTRWQRKLEGISSSKVSDKPAAETPDPPHCG